MAAGSVVILLPLAVIAVEHVRDGPPVAKTPEVQMAFSSLLHSPPQFSQIIEAVAVPMAVAISVDGSVYVVEGGQGRLVRRFDTDGKPLGALAPPGTDSGTRMPVSVAVSPKGDVYVADRAAQAVDVYTGQGNYAGRLASPFGNEGWQPLGLGSDRAGNIYVTDVTPGKHRVVVLDPGGTLRLAFGQPGSDDGEFSFPNAIAVDQKGTMFVSDGNNGRVQMFDAAGTFVGAIEHGSGPGELGLPRGLAIDDSDHLLFVVDAARRAVQYYDISGSAPRFVNAFGNSPKPSSNLASPSGISVDGKGHVFVVDRERNRVMAWHY